MLHLLPSAGCIKAYIVINAPLVALGYLVHTLLRLSSSVASDENAFSIIILNTVILGLKNLTLLFGIGYLTRNRRDIIERNLSVDGSDSKDSKAEWELIIRSVVSFTILETLTYKFSRAFDLIIYLKSSSKLTALGSAQSFLSFYGSFIVNSFCLEVIFDFFHYWSHRLLHEKPALYRSLHSLHHHNANPTVYHTFNDTIVGTLFTNTIPHLLALTIFMALFGRPILHLEHSLLLVYKTFVEVSGHSGKELGKASSFPQFKWLPVWLGIELYTFDHHSHHRNAKRNFSKRFVLWDKVFDTYLCIATSKKF